MHMVRSTTGKWIAPSPQHHQTADALQSSGGSQAFKDSQLLFSPYADETIVVTGTPPTGGPTDPYPGMADSGGGGGGGSTGTTDDDYIRPGDGDPNDSVRTSVQDYSTPIGDFVLANTTKQVKPTNGNRPLNDHSDGNNSTVHTQADTAQVGGQIQAHYYYDQTNPDGSHTRYGGDISITPPDPSKIISNLVDTIVKDFFDAVQKTYKDYVPGNATSPSAAHPDGTVQPNYDFAFLDLMTDEMRDNVARDVGANYGGTTPEAKSGGQIASVSYHKDVPLSSSGSHYIVPSDSRHIDSIVPKTN